MPQTFSKHLTILISTALITLGAGCAPTNPETSNPESAPTPTPNTAVNTPVVNAPTPEPAPVASPPTPTDTTATSKPAPEPPASTEPATKPAAQTEPATPTESTTQTKPSAPAVKTFSVTAKTWEFTPSVITVNQGDQVRLEIKSLDVTHSFSLPDFNIKITLEPGVPQTVEFTADKTGEFVFACRVYCGDGHADMKGRLIVK
ncbi:MAG: cupredoxin domain-containing protein [Candidatus Magasanikbacteria bacterium]|nr:cupredoxin domain-containing protein [Candidatus Magasanikbacteria bacterium]